VALRGQIRALLALYEASSGQAKPRQKHYSEKNPLTRNKRILKDRSKTGHTGQKARVFATKINRNVCMKLEGGLYDRIGQRRMTE